MEYFVVEYYSNNSGGYEWMSDSDWDALEANGWTVNGRYATIVVRAKTWQNAQRNAKARWSKALPDQSVNAMGCSCCGAPHRFITETAADWERYND